MRRLAPFAPSLLMLITAAVVLVAGPDLVRRIGHSATTVQVRVVRDQLLRDDLLDRMNAAVRRVAIAVEPSVVHITVTRSRSGAAVSGLRNNGGNGLNNRIFDIPEVYSGSGWVYDAAGHIVTNHHVVMDATEIEVRFYDGTPARGHLVGFDDKTDIAVIRVNDVAVLPAQRATGEPVVQGDLVFAFGSPFGFKFSMSSGLVSGQARQAGLTGVTGSYENFIQTDAAINPGNSGGPLVNVRGQVVGMNTAIATDPTDPIRSGRFTGVGLAIPLDMIEFVVDQIIATGNVRRGGLGLGLEDIDQGDARRLGYAGVGVLVVDVFVAGPAEQAGVQDDDIIVAVDGEPVVSRESFRSRVHARPPGSVLHCDVWRKDRGVEAVQIVLEDWNALVERPFELLGLKAVLIDSEMLGLRNHSGRTALVVTSVAPNSIAESAGFEPQMILDRAILPDGSMQPILNLETLSRLLQTYGARDNLGIQAYSPDLQAFEILSVTLP